MFSPERAGNGREQAAMAGDETVGAFGSSNKYWRMDVPVEEPLFMRIVGERTESGLGPGVNCSIRLDEMNGSFKLLAGNLGKSRSNGYVLERQIVQTIFGCVSPTTNPDPAKVAIAVKNHEWLCRRRCNLIGGLHLELIAEGAKRSKSRKRAGARQFRDMAGEYPIAKAQSWPDN